jgi:hypothetical protein
VDNHLWMSANWVSAGQCARTAGQRAGEGLLGAPFNANGWKLRREAQEETLQRRTHREVDRALSDAEGHEGIGGAVGVLRGF